MEYGISYWGMIPIWDIWTNDSYDSWGICWMRNTTSPGSNPNRCFPPPSNVITSLSNIPVSTRIDVCVFCTSVDPLGQARHLSTQAFPRSMQDSSAIWFWITNPGAKACVIIEIPGPLQLCFCTTHSSACRQTTGRLYATWSSSPKYSCDRVT